MPDQHADQRPTIAYGRGSTGLDFTGERFVPGTRGVIELEHVHRYLFARQFVTDRDVLDIASGEGYGSALLAGVAASVCGVDIDPDSVAHATKVHGSQKVRFLTGDCTDIPLDDDAVDIVISFETIEHLEDHAAFLKEVRRVLRPNGFFVISSPDTDHYGEHSPEDNPFHKKELDRAAFVELMQTAFESVQFGAQRYAAGSWLVPMDPVASMRTPIRFQLHPDDGCVRECGPLADAGVYLLAIATDGEQPVVDWSLLEDSTFGMADVADLLQNCHGMAESIKMFEAALRETLDELHALRRSTAVRIASRLGLAPRPRQSDTSANGNE
jgi:SAM-dependent methyltransferase